MWRECLSQGAHAATRGKRMPRLSFRVIHAACQCEAPIVALQREIQRRIVALST
jgi:hypothetical protein